MDRDVGRDISTHLSLLALPAEARLPHLFLTTLRRRSSLESGYSISIRKEGNAGPRYETKVRSPSCLDPTIYLLNAVTLEKSRLSVLAMASNKTATR